MLLLLGAVECALSPRQAGYGDGNPLGEGEPLRQIVPR
jgi:hypothetical protein